MTVNQANIDKAFALAHRASEDGPLSRQAARNIFRAIAHQIWLACGEERPTEAVLAAIQFAQFSEAEKAE
jgi:hypothetical protein